MQKLKYMDNNWEELTKENLQQFYLSPFGFQYYICLGSGVGLR